MLLKWSACRFLYNTPLNISIYAGDFNYGSTWYQSFSNITLVRNYSTGTYPSICVNVKQQRTNIMPSKPINFADIGWIRKFMHETMSTFQ